MLKEAAVHFLSTRWITLLKDLHNSNFCNYNSVKLWYSNWFCKHITAWKVSKYGDFSGPYFPTFRPNTGISPYSVRMRENTNQKKLHIWTLFTQSIDKIRCSQDFFNKFLYWIKFFPMGIVNIHDFTHTSLRNGQRFHWNKSSNLKGNQHILDEIYYFCF